MTQSSTPEASSSRPANNLITASVPADWTPGPDAAEPTPFAAAVDRVLHLTAELARNLVGAHQGAATLIVSGDWQHARKWFSLSSKYANWYDYRAPAVGVGLHALVVSENTPLRLTQAELEAHPAWRGFGDEATRHPPMRGWLAVPLIGHDQHNYGLLLDPVVRRVAPEFGAIHDGYIQLSFIMTLCSGRSLHHARFEEEKQHRVPVALRCDRADVVLRSVADRGSDSARLQRLAYRRELP